MFLPGEPTPGHQRAVSPGRARDLFLDTRSPPLAISPDSGVTFWHVNLESTQDPNVSSCRFLDDDPFSRTKGWSSRVRLLLSLCCVCGYLQLCTSGSHVIRNTFNEHHVLTPKTRRQNSPSRPRGGYHRCWKWWTRRVEDLHTRYPKT